MGTIFFILAIVFGVLWQMEKKKNSGFSNLKKEKESADIYIQSKKAEGDAFFEEKHREALDYYWKKTKSADERVKLAEEKIQNLEREKTTLNE